MDMPQALRIYSIDTVSCLQWRRHSQVFASLGAREQLYADNVRSWAEMPFPYQPLPSDAHIRLITIVKGGNSADIRLTLTVEDSSSCLRYKCLSYTWDGPRVSDTGQEWCDPVFQISINDSSVFVRRNLHDVLHHFRDLGYLGPLWIDALCINQQDGSEKDAQVARMSHIYGGAVEVLAWLGTANNSTVPAMQSMEKLLVNQDEIMTAEAGEKILNLLSKEEFNDDQMIQLFEFSIEFNWFSRIWIVQELLLAKKLIFICGTFTMGLGTVWAAEMLLVTAHAHLAGFKRAYLGGYLLGLEEVRSRAGAVTNTYRRRPFSRGCCGIFRSLFKFSSRRTTPNIIHLLNQRHGMRFLEFTSLQMDCIDFHYDLAGTRSFSPFGGLSTILEAGFRDTFNVDGENKHPLSLLANELRVKKAKNPHDKLYGILGFSSACTSS
jgi:hypothetical protein